MDQLLIALDVDSAAKALALADALRGVVGGFKIGSRLFTAEGPSIVRALVERGRPRLPRPEVPRHPEHRRDGGRRGGVARRVDGQRARVRRHAMMQAARDAAHETAARAGTARRRS